MTTDLGERAELAGLPSDRARIRRALAVVGDDPRRAVAWLAERGYPGIDHRRACDVLRIDGRPTGKPRPPKPPPGTARAKAQAAAHAERTARDELADYWRDVAASRHAASRDELLGGVREAADPADGGMPCPSCGAPMRWAGGYTALVCIEHPPGERRRRRDTLARQRAAAYRDAIAPRREMTGPGAAERAEAAEAAAVALDRIKGWLDLLDKIPRHDDQRGNATRAAHRLGLIGDRLGHAATLADIADAEAAEISVGDDFADAYSRAVQLDAERGRASVRDGADHLGRRGGLLSLLPFRRASDGAYELPASYYDGDQAEAGGDQAEAEAPAELAIVARMQAAGALPAGDAAALLSLLLGFARYCDACRRNGAPSYGLAEARAQVDATGAADDLCPGCLAAASIYHGRGLAIVERYDPARIILDAAAKWRGNAAAGIAARPA